MPNRTLDTLPRFVQAFHTRFDQPVRTTPAVPPDAEVRFRLRLIAEEFFELLEAALDLNPDRSGGLVAGYRDAVDDIKAAIDGPYPYRRLPVKVDLPEFADAMTDLDYVVEGTRAYFGIDGHPILLEVQRANMAKDPKGPDGKPVKPEGWTPPDVEGCLRRQGWTE